jgi:hypothetical protein
MIQSNERQRVALALATMLIVSVACSKHSEVSNSIRELIFERKMKTIRLVDATRFAWDQAYLFGPYTPRSEVCNTLRIQEKNCERLVPFESNDDPNMSIAFLAGGRLVHYALHNRGNGDFTPVPAYPLSPETAVFSVVQDDVTSAPQPWIKLVLK